METDARKTKIIGEDSRIRKSISTKEKVTVDLRMKRIYTISSKAGLIQKFQYCAIAETNALLNWAPRNSKPEAKLLLLHV